MEEQEVPDEIKECIFKMMLEKCKEEGIEVKPLVFTEPIPLEHWMLEKPNQQTAPYNGECFS